MAASRRCSACRHADRPPSLPTARIFHTDSLLDDPHPGGEKRALASAHAASPEGRSPRRARTGGHLPTGAQSRRQYCRAFPAVCESLLAIHPPGRGVRLVQRTPSPTGRRPGDRTGQGRHRSRRQVPRPGARPRQAQFLYGYGAFRSSSMTCRTSSRIATPACRRSSQTARRWPSTRSQPPSGSASGCWRMLAAFRQAGRGAQELLGAPWCRSWCRRARRAYSGAYITLDACPRFATWTSAIARAGAGPHAARRGDGRRRRAGTRAPRQALPNRMWREPTAGSAALNPTKDAEQDRCQVRR